MPAAQRLDPASLLLVAITDSLRDGVDGLVARAFAAVHGGASMVYLRLPEESPRTLVEVGHAIRATMPAVPLIVNGRVDVALAVGANGVHLGVDDIGAASVRRVTPPEFVIGVSVGREDEIVRAEHADFVGIGPVFGGGATEALGVTRFSALAILCGRPAVAIGGVDGSNAGEIMRAGAAGIAVISALFGSRDPASAARALRLVLDASGR